MGAEGWDVMESTIEFIGKEHLVIADAKRGDIGNTAMMYARAFFNRLKADAITLNPYMGSDTIKPFLEYPEKWGIVLALTSNATGKQLQQLKSNGKSVFQYVVDISLEVGHPGNVMFVVGGTRPEDLREMREYCPDCFFLVPGVGKQGGSVDEVMKAGQQEGGTGLLINSSRGIIFSSPEPDYAESAAREAKNMQNQMRQFIGG
jgi:orotidine-5'-phosphate decarboxylase